MLHSRLPENDPEIDVRDEIASGFGYASIIEWEFVDLEEVVRSHVWSPEGWGSVEVSAVVKLKDGRWGTACGWADTTGWGCQCDFEAKAFQTEDLAVRFGLDVTRRELLGYPEPAGWRNTDEVGVVWQSNGEAQDEGL